jgi:hypothetical protein
MRLTVPQKPAVSDTRRKTTDKCRLSGTRKVIRFSALGSAQRILIPFFGGIEAQTASAHKPR